MASSDGGNLFLSGADGVTRLQPGATPRSWPIDGPLRDLAASGDEAWVLTGDWRVLRLRTTARRVPRSFSTRRPPA